jgi:hypothetical protein
MHATCTTNPIISDLMILMIYSEEYTLYGFSLCNFLQSFIKSSLLSQTIILNTMFYSHTYIHTHTHNLVLVFDVFAITF